MSNATPFGIRRKSPHVKNCCIKWSLSQSLLPASNRHHARHQQRHSRATRCSCPLATRSICMGGWSSTLKKNGSIRNQRPATLSKKEKNTNKLYYSFIFKTLLIFEMEWFTSGDAQMCAVLLSSSSLVFPGLPYSFMRCSTVTSKS